MLESVRSESDELGREVTIAGSVEFGREVTIAVSVEIDLATGETDICLMGLTEPNLLIPLDSKCVELSGLLSLIDDICRFVDE